MAQTVTESESTKTKQRGCNSHCTLSRWLRILSVIAGSYMVRCCERSYRMDGSVPGPMLLCYTPPICQLWSTSMVFAAICTQTTRRFMVSVVHTRRWSSLNPCIYDCIDDVWTWMRVNRLQLNPVMTEMLWFTTASSDSGASHRCECAWTWSCPQWRLATYVSFVDA